MKILNDTTKTTYFEGRATKNQVKDDHVLGVLNSIAMTKKSISNRIYLSKYASYLHLGASNMKAQLECALEGLDFISGSFSSNSDSSPSE
jgi:hypothetical protein